MNNNNNNRVGRFTPYVCTMCGREHYTESAAECCCTAYARPSKTWYFCTTCDTWYPTEEQALVCSESHN